MKTRLTVFLGSGLLLFGLMSSGGGGCSSSSGAAPLGAGVGSQAAVQYTITLINNSTSTPDIVVFQKDPNAGLTTNPVAWQVFDNVAPGNSAALEFQNEVTVAAKDASGSETPEIPVTPGDVVQVMSEGSTDEEKVTQDIAGSQNIEVENELPREPVEADVFRDGHLLGEEEVMPGQKANFDFDSSIDVAVCDGILEGQTFDTSILTDSAHFSLAGIASADIVITGGGSGRFSFSLQNVVMSTP